MAKINFVESAFLNVYVNEIWELAESVDRRCRDTFEKCPVPEEHGYIIVSGEVFRWIASALNDAANIAKLLRVPERPYKENASEFAFHIERARGLADALGRPHLPQMSKVGVRNSLEHFDQRLDKASLGYIRANSPAPKAGVYNMAISSWAYLKGEFYVLKVYVANERKFYNIDLVADIDALHKEALDLIERVKRLTGRDGGPGGYLIQGLTAL